MDWLWLDGCEPPSLEWPDPELESKLFNDPSLPLLDEWSTLGRLLSLGRWLSKPCETDSLTEALDWDALPSETDKLADADDDSND